MRIAWSTMLSMRFEGKAIFQTTLQLSRVHTVGPVFFGVLLAQRKEKEFTMDLRAGHRIIEE